MSLLRHYTEAAEARVDPRVEARVDIEQGIIITDW